MSSTPETPNTQPSGDQPEVQSQTPPPVAPHPRTSAERKQQRSVIFYLSILFVAAFLLLSMSLVMERRQHAESQENLNNLNQSITGLKDSVSAMQSVQNLYQENAALQQKVAELEDQLEELNGQLDSLDQNLSAQEKQVQAMDWFWQIDEAFVRSRWSLARTLVQQLRDAGLEDYLPQESITDNGRFSPADRYAEICGKIF